MLLTKTYSLGGWGGFCESVIGRLRTSLAKPTPTIDVLITLATAILRSNLKLRFDNYYL